MAKEPIDPDIRDGQRPPLKWILTSKFGSHPVHMVRLFHIDPYGLYAQLAPPGPVNQSVIKTISKEIGGLRDYLDRKTWIQQITRENEVNYWICIPSFENEFFATKKHVWDRLIKRWPQFLDEEWLRIGAPSRN